MKIEILKCDRCNKEALTEDDKKLLDLHSVVLGTSRKFLSSSDRGVPVYADNVVWDREWCLECRKETGLAVVMELRYKTPPDQIPSLEDMVREIVRQEIQEYKP